MASTPVALKVVGTTVGSSMTIPLIGLSNVSIANAFRNLGSYFQSIGQGARSFKGAVQSGGVQATGTITLSALVATDTITIAGVTFSCVAAGATGNQFNVGGTDTITAANAVVAINASASASVANNILASSSGAVITLTCKEPGTIGNFLTTAISAHGSVSGSGLLTSGTDANVVNLAKGL